MVADIPDGGASAFQAYEAAVLPLLPRHGGRLERRLRSHDGLAEVHVVSFQSRAGYESYIRDPERLAYHGLLASVDVRQRLLEVADVTTG